MTPRSVDTDFKIDRCPICDNFRMRYYENGACQVEDFRMRCYTCDPRIKEQGVSEHIEKFWENVRAQ